MPGIFGGVSCAPSYYEQLCRYFDATWGKSEVVRGDGWLLGGHAFEGNSVFSNSSAISWAIDGEFSLYQAAARGAAELFDASSETLYLKPSCRGNVAMIDTKSRALHLAMEWSGTFPLYWTRLGDGLLFSSLLQPLAKAVGAPMDELGALQFLRQAFTYAGRSQFKGIFQLLPGQSLYFEPGGGGQFKITETSELWKGLTGRPSDRASEAQSCWELLLEGLESALPPSTTTALMVSAGWDSRTLLASITKIIGKGQVLCYTHGDPESRELQITSRLCNSVGVKCWQEPIDENVLDLGFLQTGFQRTGNVVFPHWHRAGGLLADSGVRCVLSGVYGEVLGGHYGRAMVLPGRRKITAVGVALMGKPSLASRDKAGELSDIRSLLHLKSLGRHWYLRKDFEHSLADPLSAINADIDSSLTRLRQRGIITADQIIEAFISESRGSQYINAQILSCRAYLDIAIPFTYRPLVLFASRVPFPKKVHNRLNRHILEGQAPSFLRHPTGAALVPARYPIIIQEATRLVRSLYENRSQARFYASHGETPSPRLGWPYFEFLRSGKLLHQMIDDLKSDIWDREAMRDCIADIPEFRWHVPLHSIYDQMAKIYTTDLLLR